ncbi:50S ribosomal protein L21 [Myxococcota bacterium]|nr:50S ribosomal protein L21 [Myxococcota bacterium]MCZ7617555.1 50S ribosomal protein L21 [Myxococcota bacterium]
MYAVVRTGGKQIRVSPGEAVWVENLPGEIGEQVNLEEVLLLGGEGEPQIGAPQVPGARVVATITGRGLGEKLVVFKYKRRKRYRRKQGHRQSYTQIRVDRIEA